MARRMCDGTATACPLMLLFYGRLDRRARTKIGVRVSPLALVPPLQDHPLGTPKGDPARNFDEWLSLEAVLTASIVRSG